MSDSRRDGGSFRDPSGVVFSRDGVIYRQINRVYKESYDQLLASGLYDALVEAGLLIAHKPVGLDMAVSEDACAVIRPERVGFISYPYEWCFSQLKQAALTTLAIQREAMAHGMSLKDASAYNMQFHQGRCALIDTLSFEPYREGEPWVAYRQFCQHFLAPLALMRYRDVRLGRLSATHIDGVPLDMASALLPLRTRFRFSLLAHLHLHARSQRRYAGQTDVPKRQGKVSRLGLVGLIENLEAAIRRLDWRPAGTEWGDYYNDTNYTNEAFEAKKDAIGRFLDAAAPRTVWDLGANTAVFSRLASARDIDTVAFDMDPAAVERAYRQATDDGERRLLPLVMDLTNPSSAIGWQHAERMSLVERGPADVGMALALIHHLAIGNNVPLDRCAAFFASVCRRLIIEFVPKDDSQVQRLLATREDIFGDYTHEGFESAFEPFFRIDQRVDVADSHRALYLMTRT